MSYPERPHLTPCACEQCQAWAREIVGSPGTPRARASKAPGREPDPDAEKSVAEFMADVRAAALRMTGLSPEELDRRVAEVDAERAAERASYHTVTIDARRQARRRMRAAGVLEGHIEALADRDPINCPALRAVRALHEMPKGGLLVLSGGIGTRKTGSACWLLGQCEGGLYVKANQLLSIALSDNAQFLKLSHAPAIVLDDLGTEVHDNVNKGYFAQTITSLVDDWSYSKGRAVMTCNLDPAAFKQRYGERVADRIRERGRFVRIAGESVRK